MAEIVLDRVCKSFRDGTRTLHEVSLTIGDGEFFIIVGPSGCGKSTLLNVIVGLEELSAGEIRVDGKRVDHLDAKDRDMAMVFQSYAIYPHMSVRENIAFPLRLARLPASEIARRVDAAAAMLQLDALLDRKPASLSGGQRQRVAMGRAIVREPKAFLLDEPLSNLDARLRVQMRDELARLQRQLGTTMIYVTHDQTEAMTLGHRVAVLNRGQVQQIGTPRQLYRAPANLFVARFIGTPGMNLLPARVQGLRLQLPIGEIGLSAPMMRRLSSVRAGLVAGIRPEQFHHVAEGDTPSGSLVFDVVAEWIEWLGAELYLHFALTGETTAPERWGVTAASPAPLGGSSASGRIIARLDGSAPVFAGGAARLCVARGDVQLFDAQSGSNLSATVGD